MILLFFTFHDQNHGRRFSRLQKSRKTPKRKSRNFFERVNIDFFERISTFLRKKCDRKFGTIDFFVFWLLKRIQASKNGEENFKSDIL